MGHQFPRVLVVELRRVHAEVLPSVVQAFQDAGATVDLLVNPENWALKAFACVDTRPRRVHHQVFFPRLMSRGYDLVVFNSLEPPSRGLDPALKIARRRRVAGVLHNAIQLRASDAYERARKAISILTLAEPISRRYLGDGFMHLRPHHIHDGRLPPPQPGRFVVQGSLDANRRNYESLIEALAERRLPQGVCVDLVGSAKPLERVFIRQRAEELGVADALTFSSGKLVYPDFYQRVGEAEFLLPLLEPGVSAMQPYYDYCYSSSLSVAIGLGVIPVMEGTLAEIYGLQDAAITYTRPERLVDAMVRALALSEKEKSERRQALKTIAAQSRSHNADLARRLINDRETT